MSRRDPIVYVHHMLDHAKEAVQMMRGRTRTDLDENRMLNLAVVRLVEIVGESCNRINQGFSKRASRRPLARNIGCAC